MEWQWLGFGCKFVGFVAYCCNLMRANEWLSACLQVEKSNRLVRLQLENSTIFSFLWYYENKSNTFIRYVK
ncbi:MAG: hypothetical protein D8H98_14875 [Prevotella sp.]|nr:MAG: hypothetical protein D8H98_14875 [Prevotella sp.]